MEELAYNREFTVAHVMNTDFERRMFDLYVGCGTEKRPPYLEEIFREASRFQAIFALESIKGNPEMLYMNEDEWAQMEEAVMQDDDNAKLDILSRISAHEIDNVVHDILLYFNKYRISALRYPVPGVPASNSDIVFSPALEVW